MKAKMATTNNIPTHIPALNIPVTTAQLLNAVAIINSVIANNEFLIMFVLKFNEREINSVPRKI
jgi:hypothetical protein